MSFGLQCFDTNGSLTFNSSDTLGRIAGSFTASGSGSTTVDFNGGRPFTFFKGSWFTPPNISISGSTISWNFPSGGSGTIYYGYY